MPDTAGASAARSRKWVTRAGALAGVAAGAGLFFAAQASSFEILGPQFGVKTTLASMDDGDGGSDRSGAQQASAPSNAGDGLAVGRAGSRAPSAAASGFGADSLRDGVITLADAAQAKFADEPAQDASMLTRPSAGQEGDGASQFAQSFSGGGGGGGQAGFPGAGGGTPAGGSGSGLPGAASGLSGMQSSTTDASDGDPNALQPLQAAVTSVAGVPEPATWTTLILGFGLIGATLRRRRTALGRA